MQLDSLQVAIFTQQSERAMAVQQLTTERGWELTIITATADSVQVLRERGVVLILIDLDWPDAIALFRRLTAELPQIPLLALTPPQQLVALQEAHLVGASGYIAYPINPRHFFVTIEQVLQSSSIPLSNTRHGRLIALVSLKGGVGRSMLATNLAIALHQQGVNDLILAEVHHGLGQLSLMLNVQPRHTIAGLADEETIDPDLLRGYFQSHQSGIRLLVAPNEPTQVAELTTDTWQQTFAVLTTLASMTIVDTAPTADRVLAEVLTTADQILLITDPTVMSLCNAQGLLETIRAGQKTDAPIHLILNQADITGGLNRNMVEQYLGEKIHLSIPFEPALATLACNRGIPLVMSHPRTLFSQRIQQLAKQLQQSSPELSEQSQFNHSGPFAWLKRIRSSMVAAPVRAIQPSVHP